MSWESYNKLYLNKYTLIYKGYSLWKTECQALYSTKNLAQDLDESITFGIQLHRSNTTWQIVLYILATLLSLYSASIWANFFINDNNDDVFRMKMISFGLGSARLIANIVFAAFILSTLNSVDLRLMKEVLEKNKEGCSDPDSYLDKALRNFVPIEEANRAFALTVIYIFSAFALCIILQATFTALILYKPEYF